jgi:hypothetical protein
MLSSLFGGDKNPMKEANQYLNQIPGVAHEGYDPYVNAGLDASGKTKSTYESLMNDPTAFINKLMEGYKPSEGYNFQKEQLQKELGNTAAMGGIAGTPQDQMNQGAGIQKLLSGDMQDFLKNVLGVFNTGLSGEEGVAGRGYDASGKLTDTLGNALNQQGELAYNNAVNQNNNKSNLWSTFGKALGGAAGSVLGPVGTAAGTALANKLF